eukprot:CAMPEP_0183359190 /NCGR_PEP_ID=MMETSP0164_2-20130417/51428_1 /TAXON_ID=221442 /ORGANISM="Coccolithus pelagicus ssp braarudi, Strain PLY182g" /LENGTH=204 /DNA_ID=CAMNT_0025533253 /DNA_START=228 /DNA_END=842 /DNA_ORIENTATION=-
MGELSLRSRQTKPPAPLPLITTKLLTPVQVGATQMLLESCFPLQHGDHLVLGRGGRFEEYPRVTAAQCVDLGENSTDQMGNALEATLSPGILFFHPSGEVCGLMPGRFQPPLGAINVHSRQADAAPEPEHMHALALLWRARGWLSNGAARAGGVTMSHPLTPRELTLMSGAVLLAGACLFVVVSCCLKHLQRARRLRFGRGDKT